jgi:hypothetical protein
MPLLIRMWLAFAKYNQLISPVEVISCFILTHIADEPICDHCLFNHYFYQ